jgi:hypothetical protein
LSILSAIENDIVVRLQEIPYLQAVNAGTVRGVSSVEMAMNLGRIPPPAIIIEYAGEAAAPGEPGPLHAGQGNTQRAQHYMRLSFDLFLIAQNFGGRYDDPQTGRLDGPDSGQKGVYTIVDDAFAKIAGFKLPSVTSHTSKTFWKSVRRFSIQDASVIYVAGVYCDTLRSN